jgi:hypothetical protein
MHVLLPRYRAWCPTFKASRTRPKRYLRRFGIACASCRRSRPTGQPRRVTRHLSLSRVVALTSWQSARRQNRMIHRCVAESPRARNVCAQYDRRSLTLRHGQLNDRGSIYVRIAPSRLLG